MVESAITRPVPVQEQQAKLTAARTAYEIGKEREADKSARDAEEDAWARESNATFAPQAVVDELAADADDAADAAKPRPVPHKPHGKKR